jgi:hypothetical protein
MDGNTFGGSTLANQSWTTSYINQVFSQAVITVGNTTNTSGAYPSGALRIAGGLSVKKDTYMDGALTVNGALNATVSTSAQPNITSLGTLTSLTSQGKIIITDNTATTQLGQGALQVSGGASIAGNLYVGGTLNLTGSQLDIDSATFSNGVTISGSTTPATEYFTITDGAVSPTTTFRVDTANGNLVTNGSITASSFVGGVATISDTAPALTASGSLWFSSVTGGLYLKYTSGEWVQVYNPGGGTSSGSSSYVLPTATAKTIGGVRVDGTTVTITPTGIITAALPTAVSQLTNDSGYVTSSSLTSYAPLANPQFTGTVNIIGTTVLQQTIERFSSATIISNSVLLDFTAGAIFYLGSNSSNITANFTNVPTAPGQTMSVTLVISQTGTAYIPSAININASSQQILWQGGSAPSGNANKTDVVSFTFICTTFSTYTVLGTLSTYG